MPDVGRTAPNEKHDQSLQFDKDFWTVESAKQYLRKNDYYDDGIDVGKTVIRARQYNPESDRFKYRMRNLDEEGVKAVFGIPKGE
jgi:hypothetical protein